MTRYSIKLLHFLYCMLIVVIVFKITLIALIFTTKHLIFSFSFLFLACGLIFVVIPKIFSIKIHFFNNWIKYTIPIAIYMYMAWISGAPILSENIFIAASPVTLIFDGSGKSNTPVDQIYKFPFWKTFWTRLWYDMPLRNRPFLRANYIVKATYYYNNDNQNTPVSEIHNSKSITCIFKNVGDKTLVLRDVKKLILQRSNGVPVEASSTINNYLSKYPIILYPLEELVIVNTSFACYGESINIETEVEYTDFPEKQHVFVCHQTDKTKFDNNSPRILSAKSIIKDPE